MASSLGDQAGPPGEANTDRHQELAREIATEGGVLLKNDDPGLPLDLDAIDSIAVIGPDADRAKTGGGGSSNITTPPGSEVGPVEGIQRRAAPDAAVTHTTGDATADAVAMATAADVAVVVATGDSTEQTDREDIQLPHGQNELIREVAAANEHTIVVLRTGGPVVMPWLDDVPAVLEMWYPGMMDGLATADLLFGHATPSGRLPVTFGASREDYPATEEHEYPGVDSGDGYPVVEYTEGIYVGYRWFDEHDIEPLFPFGHGLSYTEFEYEALEVTPRTLNPGHEAATVRVDVTNTGDRQGAEVVQVYVAPQDPSVGRPPKELAGFEKIDLATGETGTAEIELDVEDLAYFDIERGDWAVESGTYSVLVGRSSRDIREQETLRYASGR